jgi:hypothetical protein
LGVEYPSYACRQKVQILFFKSKWDKLSVLNIENEKYFVSKNRGAAPLKTIYLSPMETRSISSPFKDNILVADGDAFYQMKTYTLSSTWGSFRQSTAPRAGS